MTLKSWNVARHVDYTAWEWEYHGLLESQFTKEANVEYEIGMCAVIAGAETPAYDCVQGRFATGNSGMFTVTDHFVTEAEIADGDAEFKLDEVLLAEEENVENPVELQSQDWVANIDGLKLTCDEDDNCTMSLQFMRDYTTWGVTEDF